jgi:hypothetical protein
MNLRRCLLGYVGLAVVTGCGQAKSLGENNAMGGVAAGGMATGGIAEDGGSENTGASMGGFAWTGGTSSGGFIGNSAGEKATAYPLAPSVPINAGCECGLDETRVCNAASACVPRCDSDGDCAIWKLNRGLASLWVDGSTVYALESLATDRFGNVIGTSQGLLTAELGARSLLRLADVPATANRNRGILGRLGDAIFLAGADIVARHDDNTFSVFTPPPDYYSAVLKGDSLFVTNAEGVWAVDVTQGTGSTNTFVKIHSAPIQPGTQLVAGDNLWFAVHSYEGEGWADKLCSLAPEPTPVELGCIDISGMVYGNPIAAKGPQVFVRDDHGSVIRDELGKPPFTLFRPTAPGDEALGEATLFGDSFYAYIAWNNRRLIRFPTQSADLEVDVIPKPVVTVMATEQPALGYHSNVGILYAVGEAGIFWIQGWGEHEEANFSRYVFHRPL